MSRIIWITGAGGLIGSALVQAGRQLGPDWHIKGLTRSILDLTDTAAVARTFQEDRPQIIIHCAALSRNPDCDANPALARQLNLEVTEQLAQLSSAARFIFFSTDLVFDGRRGNYVESDVVNPLSIYAETKVRAEEVVRRHPNSLILRTSLNGGTSPTGDRGFNEQLRQAWKSGRSTPLFVDEFRCPIGAEVTARATLELALQNLRGVCHLAGTQRLSRHAIGESLAARWPEFHPRIVAGSLKDYSGSPRSPDTSLDCSLAQRNLSSPLPGFIEWLSQQPSGTF